MSLPVGLVRDLSGRVVKHPDEEVRDRIAFVFATLLQVKSIHGVVRDMVAAKLQLPRQERGRNDGSIVWRRPTAAAISSLLRNPAYAGTFVYGRTHFHPRVPGGPSRKHPLPPEQWQFMVPDKYPAYIDRDTYAAIQSILRDNYQEYHRRRSRGVARSGAALLQGLAYCGQCGNKMTVQYHVAPRYICNHHKMQSAGKECQRLPIAPIDACVVRNFWEALSLAELDCYDEAVAAFDKQRRQVERARNQQLDRRRYEARLAEKQYRLGAQNSKRQGDVPDNRRSHDVPQGAVTAVTKSAASISRGRFVVLECFRNGRFYSLAPQIFRQDSTSGIDQECRGDRGDVVRGRN